MLQTKPFNTATLQTYTQTQEYNEEDKERVYEEPQMLSQQIFY